MAIFLFYCIKHAKGKKKSDTFAFQNFINLFIHFIREVFYMIVVTIKEGENVEKALKKLKRKFEKTGVVKELRARQKFTKKSVIAREQLRKAIYVQKLREKEEE